jgi:hypothetical protein
MYNTQTVNSPSWEVPLSDFSKWMIVISICTTNNYKLKDFMSSDKKQFIGILGPVALYIDYLHVCNYTVQQGIV